MGLGNFIDTVYEPDTLTGLDPLRKILLSNNLLIRQSRFQAKVGLSTASSDAGAYDADDSNPWVPGIDWTYVAYPSNC